MSVRKLIRIGVARGFTYSIEFRIPSVKKMTHFSEHIKKESYCYMQKDDSNKRKKRISVEVVDISSSVAENEMTLKSDNTQDGTTKLTKEDLHHLFQFR